MYYIFYADAISTTQIDWDTYVEKLIALSMAAEKANREQEPQKIVGYSIHPQNQETDTKILLDIPIDPVQRSIHSNDENGKPTLHVMQELSIIKKEI